MARYPCTSRAITLTQAKVISAAFDHAVRLGLRLNYHLIIHWRLTEFCDEPFPALQRLFELMRKWLSRRGVAEIWIWVRERERQSSEHVHIALFCPPRLASKLEAAINRWTAPFDPRAVLLKPCLNTPYCNARTLVQGYFLKGGNETVRRKFPVPSKDRASPHQGLIEGKRVGVSRPIGAKAIRSYYATPSLYFPHPRQSQATTPTQRSAGETVDGDTPPCGGVCSEH